MKSQINIKNWLKNLILILTVSLGSVSKGQSLVEAKEKAVTVNQLKEAADVVIYSLENVTNGVVVEDVKRLDPAAGGALSYKVAAEISVRFSAGLELAKYIVQDKSMTQEQKKALLRPLAVALGTVYSTAMRHHYDDELDPEKDKSHKVVQFLRRATKEFWFTLRDLTTRSPKPNIVKPPVVGADGLIVQPGQLSPIWNGANVDGERVWRFKEKMIREVLGQEITIELQKAFKEIGDIKNEGADDAMRFMYFMDDERMGNAEKALALRQSRVMAHYSVFAAIAGVTAMWTLMPIDWFGFVFQARDYSLASGYISDILTVSALATIALAKKATAAFSTIPTLKNLIKILEKPGQEAKISEMKLPLFSRIMKIREKVNLAKGNVSCRLVLPTGK